MRSKGTKASDRARRASPGGEPILLGVDTGGTFTDLVCFDGGQLRVHKLLSTPDNPARAVLQGLHELLADGASAGIPRAAKITYGSTVATNAVLERKGARVALLTTEGFEDLLEIGRQTRPALYALEPEKPDPLVSRDARIGLRERMSFDGEVLAGLSRAAVRRAMREVERLGAESVAVCLLHSYANPAHERLLGRALRAAGVSFSLSHELLAEYREYERLSTTVINAYVTPVMQRHLSELRRGVGHASLRVMQSNGGAISVGTAGREAVRTLLSGPAGGVIGALAAARRLGFGRIISFDMGGTSTDVSLVDGDVRLQTEWSIAELPVKVPAIDIHTVGAGGGSLAFCDAGGALKVGPESAGADPGPACYGRGTEATVTDANVVLGRLVPDAFLGGRMLLDGERARRALQRLGRVLRRSPEEAADGVVRVVNAGMERAIRRISVERGHDPREYTLVTFGGAAGLHACELAMGLGIERVLLPRQPGLLSALGGVTADLQRDYVQTVRLLDPSPAELTKRFRPMQARARRDLRAEGAAVTAITIAASLDARYRGQSYEIPVPMRSDYRKEFHQAHERLYGYSDPSRPVEVVNLRVAASARSEAPPFPPSSSQPPRSSRHRIHWGGRWVRAQLYSRDGLPSSRVVGPAVVTEFSATLLVPKDWTARIADTGDLLLQWRRQ